MLSFVLRRALLRSSIFPVAQRLPLRAVLSKQCFALNAWRNFVTTTNDRDSQSTSASEPEPKPKSKRKSTPKKTGSSSKAKGRTKGKKVTKRSAKKAKTKKKIVVRPSDKPPKAPPTSYALWLMDWLREQPKITSLSDAQIMTKKAGQTWHTVSEYEKQRYREKYESLRADYNKRKEEWRTQVDPRVLREMNRLRVSKGRPRIRGPHTGRPMSGFIRYSQHVREEYPRTGEDHKTHFKAVAARASSQWKAMSDAEKAKYNDPAKAEFAAWREKRRAESQAKQ